MNEDLLENIKQIYKDKEAEINGRKYKITKVNHAKRKKVFAYLMKNMKLLQEGDLSFVGTEEFDKIEEIISNLVTFEDSLLAKLPNHWDEYPEDYLIFINSMLLVFSYPFLAGGVIN